jgi:hypothetical protein
MVCFSCWGGGGGTQGNCSVVILHCKDLLLVPYQWQHSSLGLIVTQESYGGALAPNIKYLDLALNLIMANLNSNIA